jgi:hypothetical protein
VNEDDVEEPVDAAIEELLPTRPAEAARNVERIHVVADVGEQRRLAAEQPEREQIEREGDVADLDDVGLQGSNAADDAQPLGVIAKRAADPADFSE